MSKTVPPVSSRRRVPAWLLILFCVCCIAAVCGVAYMFTLDRQAQTIQSIEDREASPVVPRAGDSSEDELPENPVNFISLKQENPDIYAWLSIPGTNINEPILQHLTDDFYYLDHDRYGNANGYGAVFTQHMNKTDFSDPVTVAYGHVSHDKDLMFRELHNFEDPAFFKEHKDIYVYTPGHILTYEIVSAYEYDNRHILNSVDMSDLSARRAYFDSVLAPDSVVACVREGASIPDDARLLQLSTCKLGEWHGPDRFIVSAVLTSDQKTK